MALSPHINTRENEKFCETTGGDTAVRVCLDQGEGLDPIPVKRPGIGFAQYGESSSVASGSEETIISFTVPAGKTFLLKNVEVGGTNLAKFRVMIGASTLGTKRTWWVKWNESFNYDDLEIAGGVVITVKVIHTRPSVADFEATLNGRLQ